MIYFLLLFINGIVMSSIFIFSYSKITGKEICIKRRNVFFIIISCAFIIALMYKYITSFVRFLFNYIMFVIFNRYLFKLNIIKTTLSTFVVFFTLFISEIIYTILVLLVFKIDIEQIKNIYFADFLSNIFISVIMYIIFKINIILKYYKKIINNIELENNKFTIILTILSILILSILFYYIYYELTGIPSVIASTLLIAMFAYLTLLVFQERTENIKFQIEYEALMKNLNEYEKILDKHRLSNHDNKNNLLVIKGMVGSDDSDIRNYIDSILKEQAIDDDELVIKTKKIPYGGLQGLVYQKLLIMKDKKLKFFLHVDERVKDVNFKKIADITNKQICTIVGIYLDNAIEAAEKTKAKKIQIDFYANNEEFMISIANSYSNNIEFDKIDKKGYSTKGPNRGYGLSIVQQIIVGNKQLKVLRNINGDMFKQTLKITYNK